jgi:hypothetical protein
MHCTVLVSVLFWASFFFLVFLFEARDGVRHPSLSYLVRTRMDLEGRRIGMEWTWWSKGKPKGRREGGEEKLSSERSLLSTGFGICGYPCSTDQQYLSKGRWGPNMEQYQCKGDDHTTFVDGWLYCTVAPNMRYISFTVVTVQNLPTIDYDIASGRCFRPLRS